MNNLLFIYTLLASVIFDSWAFFEITKIKFKLKWKNIIFIVLLILFAVLSVFDPLTLLGSNILELIIFTQFFRKKSNIYVSLGTALLILSLDTIETIFLGAIDNNLYEFLFLNVWLTILFFLIKKYSPYIKKQLHALG